MMMQLQRISQTCIYCLDKELLFKDGTQQNCSNMLEHGENNPT